MEVNPGEKNPGGPKEFKPFRSFQIRWDEKLYYEDDPYLRRWTFTFFGYSLRIHRWYRSDDKRYFHDHPWDFLTVMLWGTYDNVTAEGRKTYRPGHFSFVKAEAQHYVEVPKGWGALTLLLAAPPRKKWGYYVNGKLWRPLRYYHKFGHPPRGEQ